MPDAKFQPLDKEQEIIEAATLALRENKLNECRKLAEPIFTHYHTNKHPLTPELTRLFAVFVAVGNGHLEALKLLDEPLQNP
jgi:hypothetical protein